jgi:hypothetical protein
MVDAILRSLACLPVMPVYASNARPVYLDKDKAEDEVIRQDRAEISDEARAQYAIALASNREAKAATIQSKQETAQTASASEQRLTADAVVKAESSNSEKPDSGSSGKQDSELTESEKREVARLQKRDTEVRTHEQAHLAASGGMAAGGPSYEYETGPDGKKYAVGGEVPIASNSGNTPQERLQNAEKVYRAALAPASPSSEDRAIASQAATDMEQARTEIAQASSAAPSTDNPNAAINISQIAKPATDAIWQKALSTYQKQDTPSTSQAKRFETAVASSLSRRVDVSA